MAEADGHANSEPPAPKPVAHAAERKAHVPQNGAILSGNELFLDTKTAKNEQFPTPQFWVSHQLSRKFREAHPSLHIASHEDSSIVLVHSPDPDVLAEINTHFGELMATMTKPRTRRARLFLNRVGMIRKDALHDILSEFGEVVALHLHGPAIPDSAAERVFGHSATCVLAVPLDVEIPTSIPFSFYVVKGHFTAVEQENDRQHGARDPKVKHPRNRKKKKRKNRKQADPPAPAHPPENPAAPAHPSEDPSQHSPPSNPENVEKKAVPSDAPAGVGLFANEDDFNHNHCNVCDEILCRCAAANIAAADVKTSVAAAGDGKAPVDGLLPDSAVQPALDISASPASLTQVPPSPALGARDGAGAQQVAPSPSDQHQDSDDSMYKENYGDDDDDTEFEDADSGASRASTPTRTLASPSTPATQLSPASPRGGGAITLNTSTGPIVVTPKPRRTQVKRRKPQSGTPTSPGAKRQNSSSSIPATPDSNPPTGWVCSVCKAPSAVSNECDKCESEDMEPAVSPSHTQ